MSVHTHALLATIVFGGIGIPATHENSPGMRRGYISRWGVLRNDRGPFSGVRDKKVQAPTVPRPQRPILSGFLRPYLSALRPGSGGLVPTGHNSAPRSVVDTFGALPTVPHGNPIPVSEV